MFSVSQRYIIASANSRGHYKIGIILRAIMKETTQFDKVQLERHQLFDLPRLLLPAIDRYYSFHSK